MDQDGNQLGVVTIQEALRTAFQANLDLIEVSPHADPPVCRIADHGKLRYQVSKRLKQSRKTQKGNEVKEIRLRPNIDDHDLRAKTAKVREFIDAGHKVRLVVRFRGREITHQNLGMNVLRKIATELKDHVKLESQPSAQGRSIVLTLVPTRTDQ